MKTTTSRRSEPPTPREIQKGQVWRRRDPSGDAVEFEVVRFGQNPFGQPSVFGRTPSGKIIQCPLGQMKNDRNRFEHVHNDRVRATA
jgi:hypothetical protein